MNAKIITALLLVAVLLCGCGGAADNSSSTPVPSEKPDVSSAPSTPASSEPTPSVPDVDVSETYGDLLAKMPTRDREVIAMGDLTAEQYADALSRLEAVLDGYDRKVSVVAYSLDGRKALGYNTRAKIFCACAVKAPYTLYCCRQMEKGAANLSTQMTYEAKHYEPGTGDMQYSPYGTVFDMRTLLGKSMSISDNVGYLMSVDYFGRDGYNEWISSLGCDSLQISPTVWSLKTRARELAVAWREIYNYFQKGGEYAKFLYDSSTGTAGNYSTQSLNVKYSHKQGHNSGGDWKSYTDAGIVWKDGSPYILVILTNAPGPSSYDANTFAEIAKIIHNELF